MENKFLFFIFQALIICNEYIFSNALIGQTIRNAYEDEFPAVVALVYPQPQPLHPITVICSGTLITFDHVLTSAHCFNNLGRVGFHIIAESSNMRNGNRYFPFWWTIYDSWANALDLPIVYEENDIAVLKLMESVSENIEVSTVLRVSSTTLFYGYSTHIAGFGLDNYNHFSMVLKTASVKIMTNAECEDFLRDKIDRHVTIHQRYLCTVSNPPILLSQGDAGGPLFYEGVILAVNKGSFPNEIGVPSTGQVNIHTSVDCYRIFIDEQMSL